MAPLEELTIAPPEPELSPEELIERARSFVPALLDEQTATEERGAHSRELHEDFRTAGIYRTLLPRRYGGYEFSITTFLRTIVEIARGCPSTGWCTCLGTGHGLMLGSWFPEAAQAEALAPDGEFVSPARAIPKGTARRVDDGWRIDGTWDYCSGAPYATHAIVAVRLAEEEDAAGAGGRPGPIPMDSGFALVPREGWTMLDDWRQRAFGLRGSGSNSIEIDGAVVPDHFVITKNPMASSEVETPGYLLHGNPMYAANFLPFIILAGSAVLVGCARGALDEYERIIRAKTTTAVLPGEAPRTVPRHKSSDYLRWYGLAYGQVDAAEAIVLRCGEEMLEMAEQALRDGVSPGMEAEMRLSASMHHANNLGWEAVELLWRTSGTSEGARRGSRIGRYFRDYATGRTNGLVYEQFAEMLARQHFDD